MDIFLAVVGGILILAGIIGSILPAIPGPPLSWLGILALHFTKFASFSTSFLVASALFMVAITVLDFYIPVWGTKKFGGTRAGVVGSTLGLLVGLFFFPPFGVVIGPFLGAFLGELLRDSNDVNKALKSATGSFLGFVLGTGMKLAFAGVMLYYFFVELSS